MLELEAQRVRLEIQLSQVGPWNLQFGVCSLGFGVCSLRYEVVDIISVILRQRTVNCKK